MYKTEKINKNSGFKKFMKTMGAMLLHPSYTELFILLSLILSGAVLCDLHNSETIKQYVKEMQKNKSKIFDVKTHIYNDSCQK